MRQPMNATGWWPRCGMDPGVQHTRSCVTLMRSLERAVPFSRQPHLTRTVQRFAHANVCIKKTSATRNAGFSKMLAAERLSNCSGVFVHGLGNLNRDLPKTEYALPDLNG